MTLTVLVVLGLVALLWVWLWVSPVHRVAFLDVLDADRDPPPVESGLPRVTLIAPARNESAVLPVTVPTYCTQSYPGVDVLVVDDQSDDDTPAVLASLAARYPNLRTVRTAERPGGWLGKTWAVASAVEHARASATGAAGDGTPAGGRDAEIYCFTDADCAFHPNAVATAVRVMREHEADLLSVLPRMDFSAACEKVGLPGLVTVLTIMFPLGRVNDPASPLALAAGGFILMRRDAYEAAGGHAAVRGHMVEDVNLARRAKSMGLQLHTRLTRDLVTTRMYADWPDMWEGLSKNAYAGMDYDPKKFWVGLVVCLLVGVLPPMYLLAGLAWVAASPASAGWAFLALSGVANAAQVAVHARTIRHMGLPVYHAVMMPVSIALYIAIATSSAYQHHFRGGNVWKGRRYGRAVVLAPGREPGR